MTPAPATGVRIVATPAGHLPTATASTTATITVTTKAKTATDDTRFTL